MVSIKEEARRLIEKLPENSTWEDLTEQIYVRKTIEARHADVEAGGTVPLKDVRQRFELEP